MPQPPRTARRPNTRFSSLAAVLPLAAVLTSPASAQDAGGATALEELKVNGGRGGAVTAEGYVGTRRATGAKTGTPFLETPQSISSVTRL